MLYHHFDLRSQSSHIRNEINYGDRFFLLIAFLPVLFSVLIVEKVRKIQQAFLDPLYGVLVEDAVIRTVMSRFEGWPRSLC